MYIIHHIHRPNTSLYRPFTSLVRFIPRSFIFLVAIANGTYFFWFLFLIFHSWCTEMPLISEYWLCIPVFCQIHLIGWIVFGGVCRFFYVYYHVICKQWQFSFLLTILDACYFLFVWSLWLELPILHWIEVLKADILVWCLILVGKLFIFAHWVSCWLAVSHIWPLLWWVMLPLLPLCWVFLS